MSFSNYFGRCSLSFGLKKYLNKSLISTKDGEFLQQSESFIWWTRETKFHADCFTDSLLQRRWETELNVECNHGPYVSFNWMWKAPIWHSNLRVFLRSMRKRSAVERTTATNAITIPTNELVKDFRHAL